MILTEYIGIAYSFSNPTLITFWTYKWAGDKPD
jgi:hypothetical protein